MPVDLRGLTVAVLGGDQRERILIDALLHCGARVVAVGYGELPDHPNLTLSRSPCEAVAQVHAVIAPMSNTDAQGRIKAVPDPSQTIRLDGDLFQCMRRGTPLLIGVAQPVVRSLAEAHGIRLIETAEVDEIATLNSIPTAEGAIQRAMEELPITIHGSHATVIGFGRCGMTLGRMLAALGAKTRVVARNPAQLARAWEMGLEGVGWEALAEAVAASDVVFNTVPAPVLSRAVLEKVPPDRTVIIDIASAPGGTDFEAAKALGIKAYLELGLPGRVAPKTAGEILARCVPALIRDLCT